MKLFYFLVFLKLFKIVRRAFIFQSIGLIFSSNIVWIMPNKTIRPDFFIFVIVSKRKRKKCPTFFFGGD